MGILRDLDIPEEGSGHTASPNVMVLHNGKYRFDVDLRRINSITRSDEYLIPRPDSVFTALSGGQYFSTMYGNKGYHQLKLSPQS